MHYFKLSFYFYLLLLAPILANSYDYSSLGQVVEIENNDKKIIAHLQRMVEDQNAQTSYNREAIVEVLQELQQYPKIKMVGYQLRNEIKKEYFEKKVSAFALLEEDNDGKFHMVLFFTGPGDRNKAWASVLSRYLANIKIVTKLILYPTKLLTPAGYQNFGFT